MKTTQIIDFTSTMLRFRVKVQVLFYSCKGIHISKDGTVFLIIEYFLHWHLG